MLLFFYELWSYIQWKFPSVHVVTMEFSRMKLNENSLQDTLDGEQTF